MTWGRRLLRTTWTSTEFELGLAKVLDIEGERHRQLWNDGAMTKRTRTETRRTASNYKKRPWKQRWERSRSFPRKAKLNSGPTVMTAAEAYGLAGHRQRWYEGVCNHCD